MSYVCIIAHFCQSAVELLLLTYQLHPLPQVFFFFFQAEDGILDAQESRGLGDLYKRQVPEALHGGGTNAVNIAFALVRNQPELSRCAEVEFCLLYTSDAADDLLCVDLGGRRIIKKKNKHNNNHQRHPLTKLIHNGPTTPQHNNYLTP